jgi:hypothetical protein
LKTGRNGTWGGSVVVVVVVGTVVVVVVVVGVVGVEPPDPARIAAVPPATTSTPPAMAAFAPVPRPAPTKPSGRRGNTVTVALSSQGAASSRSSQSASDFTTKASVSAVRLSANWRSEASR